VRRPIEGEQRDPHPLASLAGTLERCERTRIPQRLDRDTRLALLERSEAVEILHAPVSTVELHDFATFDRCAELAGLGKTAPDRSMPLDSVPRWSY
jgi:hypothetical protein